MSESVKFWGVVPAAGVGKRMQSDRPKQYLLLGDQTVIEQTLFQLLEANCFAGIAVAISSEDPYWPTLPCSQQEKIIRAEGGRERADSVLSALNALVGKASDNDWVLVHDAARPCIKTSDIHRLINTLKSDPVGGILALPSHDTLKNVMQGQIVDSVDRNRVWRALTPQMFRYGVLKKVLQLAAEKGQVVTDEASAFELNGLQPKIVEGQPGNIKITRPEDLILAKFYMEQE
ncbi:MAG TPA: 2-C-methyl-D-erythritol 4-phosphate cytidylyltransferase [Methylococcaceae bacterium]|jgi:2-C-methyl-D-erythritol 4-phosphate cytidylyltransferase|nr:2-C-methyl-D-erythritol 4-phosphate cytidylyltransferase [Methylococcaceae bacterium]HIL39437.1 2-C-methyl-D-erythritol 4-phosphate cytidylyltransferase [Methylococcales bacterium]